MKRIALLALASLLVASSARADFIYATGTDTDNNGRDDLFTVDGVAAYIVTSTANGWPVLPNAAITTGKYISWAADQSNATQGGGLGHTYEDAFSFNWAGAATTTTFDFRWLSDDYLTDIKLNEASLGVNNIGQPSPWTTSYSASVQGNVVSGLNTVKFFIANTGGQAPGYQGVSGPTGLAADFTVHGDATSVPDGGLTLALLGFGLTSLGVLRRRIG